MCVCEATGASSMFRLICRSMDLGEDDANLRFELGVENRVENRVERVR